MTYPVDNPGVSDTAAPRGKRRTVTVPAAAMRPVETDEVRWMTVGTAVWAVATVVLLLFSPVLSDRGSTWWIWVGVAGVVQGLGGVWFVRRRRANARAIAAREAAEAAGATS